MREFLENSPWRILLTQFCSWEKILSFQDTSFLISFRHHQFPEVETAARKSDFLIARLMIKALIACGWEHKALATSDTPLLKQLGRFVDIQRLAHGEIIETANGAFHTLSRDQQSPKASGNKRKATLQQPYAKKRRDSQEQTNQYGDKYAHLTLLLG